MSSPLLGVSGNRIDSLDESIARSGVVVSKAHGRSRHNPEQMSLVAHHATPYIIWAVIKSFKHKGLKRFFETGSVSGIDPAHRQKLRMRLTALDTAATIEDIDLPGFRLHPLKGDKQGRCV